MCVSPCTMANESKSPSCYHYVLSLHCIKFVLNGCNSVYQCTGRYIKQIQHTSRLVVFYVSHEQGSFHVKSTSIPTTVHHTISDFAKNCIHWHTVQIELFLIFSDFYVINWLIYRFFKFLGYSRLFATLTDSWSSYLNN